MRDVIVIGAGGGGPVVAKELAARGLDVLLLEAGPRHDGPRRQWTHFENDANNPLTGFFRLGPTDRAKPAWFREMVAELLRLAAVRRRRHHPALLRQLSAGLSRRVRRVRRCRQERVRHRRTGSRSPTPSWCRTTSGSRPPRRCRPRRWATRSRPSSTAARGSVCQYRPRRTTTRPSYRPQENAILQPGGNAGKTTDPRPAGLPEGHRLHVLRVLLPGLHAADQCPAQPEFAKRSTDNSYVPMAITAEVWTPGGKPVELITDAYVDQDAHRAGRRRDDAPPESPGGTPSPASGTREDAQGRGDGRRLHREPAAVAQQRPAEPERLGRPWLHRPLLRLGRSAHSTTPPVTPRASARRRGWTSRRTAVWRTSVCRPRSRPSPLTCPTAVSAARTPTAAGRPARGTARPDGSLGPELEGDAEPTDRPAAERAGDHRRRRRGPEPGRRCRRCRPTSTVRSRRSRSGSGSGLRAR